MKRGGEGEPDFGGDFGQEFGLEGDQFVLPLSSNDGAEAPLDPDFDPLEPVPLSDDMKAWFAAKERRDKATARGYLVGRYVAEVMNPRYGRGRYRRLRT